MSTTNTKKELIDFLWEWAIPYGNWGQLLIEKITTKQSTLEQTEREQVFNYYLQDIGFVFTPPLPAINISKPTLSLHSQDVTLTKLSDVKGVNRLAENQELDFSPNITVIYGNNGVGKTGYSRILKSLGFSFDKNNNILSNVSDSQTAQSARIDFIANGDNFYFNWDGQSTTDELSAISVFNNDCVNFSLSTGRELLVSPQGFYLFKLVKDELGNLAQMHKNHYNQYPTTLVWKEKLHFDTPQSKFINDLSNTSDLKRLNELSVFSEQNLTDLTQKDKELKGLNKVALTTQLKNTNLIINELNSAITSIKQTQLNLTKTDWDNIKQYNKSLKGLQKKAQIGISNLAETYGLEMFESEEFSNFLKSADSYIKLLNNENYPNNDDDTCVYCKQSLQTKEAKNLLDNYKKILNDTTQSEIAKYQNLKTKIIDKVNLVNDNIIFHQPTFGTNEQDVVIQPKEIIEYNSIIKLFKDAIINDKVVDTNDFNIDYTGYTTYFETKRAEFEKARDTISTRLKNLSVAENKLIAEINELKDRKVLSENKKDITDCITNLLAHKFLNNNKNHFSTDSLSRKTTQARGELVAQDFEQKFKKELKRFRKEHLNIDMSFRTDRGSSHLNQKISSYNINDVLSEGEQKAIALAEFLTELQMDNTVAPVVFDDPVNSLDHHIIDDTARRLIELSKERQVVVFTHSILLYNNFYSMSQSNYPLYNDVDFKFYKVKTEFNTTGVIYEGGEINKISAPIKKLNIMFQNAGKDGRTEESITKEGYGFLRTALELFITDEILQKTVKRYRKNVVMSGFPKIKGELIEKHKAVLNEIFERSSGFIVGHSNPEQVNTSPSFIDLQNDFKSFKDIRAEFLK